MFNFYRLHEFPIVIWWIMPWWNEVFDNASFFFFDEMMVIMWWIQDYNWQKRTHECPGWSKITPPFENIISSKTLAPVNQQNNSFLATLCPTVRLKVSSHVKTITHLNSHAWRFSGIRWPSRLLRLLSVFSVLTRRCRRWKSHSKTAQHSFTLFFRPGVWFAKPYSTVNLKQNTFWNKTRIIFGGEGRSGSKNVIYGKTVVFPFYEYRKS